jgi:hypothetical protein
VAFEDLALVGVPRPGALRTAALHQRHAALLAGARGTRGDDRADQGHRHDRGGDAGGEPAPGDEGGEGDAGDDGHLDQQQRPAQAQHRRQGPRHLADGQAREGDAAERPRPAQELGQGDRAGQRHPPAGRGGRHDGDRRAEEGGVRERRDHVARGGHVDHPEQRRDVQAQPDGGAAAEPRPAGPVGDQPVEAGQSDERQRPPAPRGQGGGDEHPGAEAREREDGPVLAHAASMIARAGDPHPSAPPAAGVVGA